MHISPVTKLLAALVLSLALSVPQALHAQDRAKPFKREELAQMLAPIALYPDSLLTNVLVASTYPLEVVQAARWRKEPGNAKLKGEALTKALEAKDWDPSVKSLTQVPDVLETMSEKLDWTQKLGDAFIAQQEDVMAEVQYLRKKADQAGSLKTNKQQKVSKTENYIVIEPAKPDVVYVPVYQPSVVYGPWWYPSYPPYYWSYGYPASSFVSGFFWGAGIAVAANLWDWGRCDWGRNNINIDINKYNNINRNRQQITSNRWQHDPGHRGSVPYRDQASREKFGKTDIKRREATKDFRGFEARDGGQGARDKAGDRGDKVGDRGAKAGDRAGTSKGPGKAADRAGDKRPDRTKMASAAEKRPAAKSAGALDVKRGSDVKNYASRGQASLNAMASHGGRTPQIGRGGGGPSMGRVGGGGGRGGGGRRR